VTRRTTAVVFPFDLFGSGGAGAGAQLLGDELREILADNKRETAITRARAYSPHVRIREVPFVSTEDYADWRKRGRRVAREALRGGDFLIWLAGNHLGALPVYDELAALGDDVLVVQLDAHLDIHHFRDTASTLSHGNFLLYVEGGLPPLVNVGHRDLLLPAEYVGRYYRQEIAASRLHSTLAEALASVRKACAGTKRVFLDLDCDVFDVSAFPAVGEPVPFGLSPGQVLAVLEAVGPLAGVMVSEFAPGRDERDRSLGILVWLLEFFMLKEYE
jgi:arginase family enzyme